MEEHQLSPGQRAQFDALEADCECELVRVAVDRRAAFRQLHNHAPVERRLSEEDIVVELSVDLRGIVETLRNLPDSAGTTAFVSAYNAAHPRFR